jgi:hypothetical protein
LLEKAREESGCQGLTWDLGLEQRRGHPRQVTQPEHGKLQLPNS